ncbi:hypothetical protein NLU13_1182 [Sarocladium strictum]|uniref:Uncharacterized protein n=1 Tax=Sarocladium strictum TaxID=5046 RepID=A0AA39LBZ7_SARSR|nr:hypothetical protein NLU13_1182 [Sarocladium strictum]
MPNDIDRSLLDRLQALRGASEPPESSPRISIDTIERAKTPTREDTLAARLKSLRSQDASPHAQSSPSPAPAPRKNDAGTGTAQTPDEDVDEAFETDDATLEDLLADVGGDETAFAAVHAEPDDAKVKALLEELADSIPQDEDGETRSHRGTKRDEGEEQTAEDDDDDDDDSDGEKMGKEVDDVVKRYRDEIEMESKLGLNESESEREEEHDGPERRDAPRDEQLPSLDDLPSIPADTTTNTSSSPSSSSTPADLDSITTRLAALRTSSSHSADLPSVPTSKPSKPPNRLTSRTDYTDDDADSWCTVCLEDATVRCLGCDGDVYCTRCWKEMHRGERAGYEERGHKAVEYKRETKGERRRVAIGAS